MKVVKANTYLGKKLVARGQNREGFSLNQIYDKWSDAKERAWNWCYEKYLEEKGTDFSIVSHNTFGFSVSWFTEEGMRLETPQNSYLVVFDE